MNNVPLIRKDLFGFTHIPFLNPDDDPYLEPTRQDALHKLQLFLEYRGFAVVTGDTGCGKTRLISCLANSLNPNASKIIYIPFAFFNERDMLRAICQGLEIESAFHKQAIIHNIHHRIKEIHKLNPLLILDEIQHISQQTLETIRILCNFQFDSKNHFSLIMSGAETFLERLRRRINEPLRQRITLFISLPPLNRDRTQEYIQHHIKAAGAQQALFSPQALSQIHDAANGVPRLINNIALAALHHASNQTSPAVELNHVHAAINSALIPKREVKI